MASDATFAILATGPSMSQALADLVQSCPWVSAIAVSDAWRLAPWAAALVSADRAWWMAHPEARQFAGRRVAGVTAPGCETLAIGSGSSSGLIACHLAVAMGARRILLLGFDMHGAHFFGAHPEPLKNTTPQRFDVFRRQFARFHPAGVEILNCTPGSSLTAYPMASLQEAMA